MKRIGSIVGLLLVVLLIMAVMFTGCKKATGGGSFYDEDTGNFITFGFNAQPVGAPYVLDDEQVVDAKGKFTLIDHTTQVKIKGDFTLTAPIEEVDESGFVGTCMVGDDGPYWLAANFFDAGEGNLEDEVEIAVFEDEQDPEGTLICYYNGTLEEGSDIVIH